MKLKPILFSTPMVLALLAGTKTQTRRLVKPQPRSEPVYHGNLSGIEWVYRHSDKHDGVPLNQILEFCKYQVGDVLWVRETWLELVDPHRTDEERYVYRAHPKNDADSEEIRQDYIKAGFPYKWKPSLFMPKEACRLFLEVTNIRVERLQEISESDAIAEGIEQVDAYHGSPVWKDYAGKGNHIFMHPVNSYCSLWEKINGPDSWETNPFVWVYEFKQVEKPTKS